MALIGAGKDRLRTIGNGAGAIERGNDGGGIVAIDDFHVPALGFKFEAINIHIVAVHRWAGLTEGVDVAHHREILEALERSECSGFPVASLGEFTITREDVDAGIATGSAGAQGEACGDAEPLAERAGGSIHAGNDRVVNMTGGTLASVDIGQPGNGAYAFGGYNPPTSVMTFTSASDGSPAVINAAQIGLSNAAQFTVNPGPGPVQLLVSSSIVGGGYIYKEGTGTMLMTSAADTYIGTTQIIGGTLEYASTGSCPMYTSVGSVGESGAGNQVIVWPGATAAFQVGGNASSSTAGWTADQLNTLLTNMVNYTNGGFSPLPGMHEVGASGWQPGSTLAMDTTYAAGGFDYPYAITGAMALVKMGPNTLTLDGANTYAGSTTISGGMLQFASPASLYNAAVGSWTAANISVASGAALAVNVGGASDFQPADVTNLLSGIDGAVNNNGLQAGSSIGFDTTNATAPVTLSNNIADTTGPGGGSVGLVKLGPGALILTGSNSYTGPTTIGGGTLEFSSAANQTLSGAISGGGALVTTGPGMLTLLGNNTYAGPTTVAGGTLQIGNGTSGKGLASPTVTMSNNATVAFNHADPLSYGGAIGGSGQFIKLGTGLLDLSGTSTYSGPTTISAGTVELDGNGDNLPLATALTIASGGALDLAGVPQTVGSLSGSAGAIITNHYSPDYPSTLTVAPSSGSTTFAGNIIGNDALAHFRQRPVDPQRDEHVHGRYDGQRRHAGHRRPERLVRQRLGDDRRRRAAGLGQRRRHWRIACGLVAGRFGRRCPQRGGVGPGGDRRIRERIGKHGAARQRPGVIATRRGKRRRRRRRGRAGAGSHRPAGGWNFDAGPRPQAMVALRIGGGITSALRKGTIADQPSLAARSDENRHSAPPIDSPPRRRSPFARLPADVRSARLSTRCTRAGAC